MEMDKKRIEILITLGLLVVLVFAAIYSLKIIKKRSAAGLALEVSSGNPDPAQGGAAVVQGQSRYDDNSFEQAAWGKCPFSGKAYSSSERALDLRITGIFWDEKSPNALINDQVVQVGGVVGAYKVVKINTNSIVFNDGSKDFEIRLGE
jgi:hypothetical protein